MLSMRQEPQEKPVALCVVVGDIATLAVTFVGEIHHVFFMSFQSLTERRLSRLQSQFTISCTMGK